MASNKNKNTSNSNVNKGLKYSTKNNLIMGSVITVLALIVIGYFVYISGFLTKVVPAVKVQQTTADGQTKTIAKIYTPELNYYRNQILNVYSMYGMQIDMDYLNAMNEEKGKTNGQLIYDAAAEEAMNVYLVNDYASKDPDFFECSERYADYELYLFGLRAKVQGYQTADQYLAAIYGTGMSSRVYKDIIANQEKTQEYEEFIRQFKFMPDKATLQAAYDEDSSLFERASFNSYFFPNSMYPDGQAEEMAQAVADASTSSMAFNIALIEQLGNEFSEAIGLTANGTQTYTENATKSITDDTQRFPEGVTDYVFNKDNIGKATVITVDVGSIVIYVDDIKIDDEATYSYRVIVIDNQAYKNLDDGEVPTDAEVAKGLEDAKTKANSLSVQASDELTFVKALKENTDAIDDITTGGYIDGVKASDFTSESATADDKALGDWLTAPERQHGDVIVIASSDNRTVKVYYFDDCMPAWMYTLAQQEITAKVNSWSTLELNVQNTVPYVSYNVVDTLSYYAQ